MALDEQRVKQFFTAIKTNDRDGVIRIAGGDAAFVRSASKAGAYSAVSYAVQQMSFGLGTSMELLTTLLDMGAHPDDRPSPEFNTALHMAADMEPGDTQTALVRLLVERGAQVDLRSPEGRDPMRAVRHPPARDVLQHADEVRQAYLDELERQRAPPATPTGQAPGSNSSSVPGTPDTNERPNVRLHRCIKHGDLTAAELLLATHGHENIINDPEETPYVALERAAVLASFGQPIRVFEQAGDEARASFWQTSETARSMVTLLLENGADPNVTKEPGALTPLHYAVMSNDSAMVRLLLEHGADPNRPDMDRITPMRMATQDSLEHVIELLRRARSLRQRFLDLSGAGANEPADRIVPQPAAGDAPAAELDFDETLWTAPVLSLRACHFRGRQATAIFVSCGATTFSINEGIQANPNVAKYIARVVLDEQREVFVAEHCGQSLRAALAGLGGAPSDAVKQAILCQICNGLKDITAADLPHPNLSCSSVMALALHRTEAAQVQIKVTAYGLQLAGFGGLALQCNPAHTAPEVYETRRWSPAASVFAFGVTAWEVLTNGQVPFANLGDDVAAIRNRVATTPAEELLPRPAGCPDAIWALVLRCLARDPQHRPGFHEIFFTLQPNYEPVGVVSANSLAADFTDRSNAFFTRARDISDPRGERRHVGHHVSHALRLTVRREHVLEDTLQFMRVQNIIRWRDLGVNITLQSNGRQEDGLDWGALTKEWLRLLSDTLFLDPNTGLFEQVEGTDPVKYRLRPDTQLIPLAQERLQFVGRMLGFMLWHRIFVNVPLVRSLFFHLLGRSLRVQDLSVDDHTVYNSMQQMLQYDEDLLGDLETPFAWENVELCTDGMNMTVNTQNRYRFVEEVAHYLMSNRSRQALGYVVTGFQEVVPVEMLQSFVPHELEVLLCGFGELDMASLRAHTRYHNCRNTHQVIRWLWEVVYEFTPEQKRDFLRFVTGSDRAPPLGFGSYVKPGGELTPFTVMLLNDAPETAFPMASTCFNYLKLPQFRSKDVLRDRLSVSIRHHGFDNQ